MTEAHVERCLTDSINQQGGANDHVKIVFNGELTIDNGEQGETASQVSLLCP